MSEKAQQTAWRAVVTGLLSILIGLVGYVVKLSYDSHTEMGRSLSLAQTNLEVVTSRVDTILAEQLGLRVQLSPIATLEHRVERIEGEQADRRPVLESCARLAGQVERIAEDLVAVAELAEENERQAIARRADAFTAGQADKLRSQITDMAQSQADWLREEAGYRESTARQLERIGAEQQRQREALLRVWAAVRRQPGGAE